VEYAAAKKIPDIAWIVRGMIEIMVRRRFDLWKHSRYVVPSVSRRASSRVRIIVAIRDSTSSAEYPSFRRFLAARASLPLLMSHHGDLKWNLAWFNCRLKESFLLWHKWKPNGGNRKNTILGYKNATICPSSSSTTITLEDQSHNQWPNSKGNTASSAENTSESRRSNLVI
jgi:hypothetical protein